MSLPQRRLSMKRSPALVLQQGQQSFNAAEIAGRIKSTQTKLDQKRAGKQTFFEDFTLDHSLSCPQVTSKAFVGTF
jgi:hypothetical protein